MSLVALQIRNHYSEFNPAMKQIADFVLSSGDRMFSMGIKELAEASGVSDASVTRFVRLLQYKSFKSFQMAWAQSSAPANEGDSSKKQAINEVFFEYGGTSPQDSAEEIGEKVFRSNIQMLSDTMKIIDYEKVEYVTKLILKARNLVFLGVGRSFVTAESGRIRFNRLGINSFCYSDSQEIIVSTTTCTSKDIFFGISNFGRSAAVVKNLVHAKERGAATVGITCAEGSPLTQVADTCFLTAFNHTNMGYHTGKQMFEPACENIPQIALLDCIYMNVALKQNKACYDMFHNTVKVLYQEKL
ncbi:MAG: MurR/RpiR family transcriptional regulator [Treponema sp.]|jgi:DNA-binding MurR/RpiR family transcriptional regulator|nr:MurR/RpiR family transcriptional regulator [Treponema sp.]